MQFLTDGVMGGGSLWPFLVWAMSMALIAMQYLKPEEVADRLRVSKWSVYRLVRLGVLPAARGLGRSIRIPEESLRDLIPEQKSTAADEAQS